MDRQTPHSAISRRNPRRLTWVLATVSTSLEHGHAIPPAIRSAYLQYKSDSAQLVH